MLFQVADGLLIDRDRRWVCRFHRDGEAWTVSPLNNVYQKW